MITTLVQIKLSEPLSLYKAKEVFADAKVNTTDGCRFDFIDGWVHIRSSNTEPIARIIVETQSETAALQYIDKVAKIREEINV